ncbi:MAG: helix-turn-helix transcriptional regulator [Thermodesulfovibrionales bacterium]|jgi:DNA-binding XRE family transcriptional regulator
MVKYTVMPKELKEWREENGYSQIELAGILGVTNVCISRWENGARAIPSFLHLTLQCMERKKGVNKRIKGHRKRKRKGDRTHGKHL